MEGNIRESEEVPSIRLIGSEEKTRVQRNIKEA